MLSSLVGTPYLPDIKGGLLFLEDVGEQPYRVERMLQQLHLAGVLA
ncbi:LD-carboxypeptidase, partial [Chromobacterium piscinae]